MALSYACSLISFYDIAYFSNFQSHIQTLFIKNLNPSIADEYTDGFIIFDYSTKKNDNLVMSNKREVCALCGTKIKIVEEIDELLKPIDPFKVIEEIEEIWQKIFRSDSGRHQREQTSPFL